MSITSIFTAAGAPTTGLGFVDWSSPASRLGQETHSKACTDEGSGRRGTGSDPTSCKPDSYPACRKTASTVGPGR